MESKKKFNEIGQIEKIFFKLSVITICTIVGNSLCVLLFVFYQPTAITSIFWVVFNVIVLLIFGGFFITKLKLNYQRILIFGFLVFLVFPVFWYILPIKIPQEYIGFRKTDDSGLYEDSSFIIADEYCRKDCGINEKLIKQGYYQERKFYSWKYAELLGRYPSDNFCCYNQTFDNIYLFGVFLLLEITFEYFPVILLLTILVSIFEYL